MGGTGATARAIHLPLWSEVNGTLGGGANAAAAPAGAGGGADGFVQIATQAGGNSAGGANANSK